MATKKMNIYTLAGMKDEYIGKIGTQERDEYELRMDVLGKMVLGKMVLGKMIKAARQERHLTKKHWESLSE